MLAEIERNVEDKQLRSDLSSSLKQLADLKFALDESSIVAMTDRRGKIQYVNDKFCDISKYSRDELLGQDHRIINSGYHGKPFMQELWKTISSGQIWRGDIRNRAKDGTYYWVNTTIVPFVDHDGAPYQYLAIRNEVTELKRVQEELQLMMNQVMRIQEEERKKFSRELHDGIGQSMFSLLIQLDQIIAKQGNHVKQDNQAKQDIQAKQGNHLKRENPENQSIQVQQDSPGKMELEKLRRGVASIMEEVRGLAWEMRPSVLDDLGVVPAIRTYIENYSQHFGIHVSFESNLRRRPDVQTETTIYRIIQEALINISKYADVSAAGVSMNEAEDQIEVRISDQGRGFLRSQERKGVGLFSMEERARGIGGQLYIQSEPGHGTTVILSIPQK
ncbi:PAS domain-containing sensor histidine kinase [Paenibacillus eucommiae]|uniref:PAS domain-containing sensor histidine kinase n=1 Tax=Paenibacillus eucommiae TaxID=1355755 RepID=UPI0024789F79|nr:PAS domain S-box protein [Paenibacillus eucommiae]